MAEKKYDIIIIGSGPGGYVAAIRASQLGLKAAVIEKEKAGGICLNLGCIPSKSLIHQATLFRSIKELSHMGLSIDTRNFDYSYVQKQSRIAAERLSKGVHFLFKKNIIDYFQAEGTFSLEKEGTFSLEKEGTFSKEKNVQLSTGENLKAENIIIATGAVPRSIPGFEIDEKDILSSTGTLLSTSIPRSILILGGGAIGIEFAYIFNSFGVTVYVVEMLERILPLEDEEIAVNLSRSLKKQGIKIRTSAKALSYKKENNSYSVIIEDKSGNKESIAVEKLLVAVGRAPNTEKLHLNDFNIKTTKGFIDVKEYYQTSVPGVFAIGDVIISPQLAHVASKEGEIAVEYIAGKNPEKKINPDLIPRAVYCEPQAAGFGPTEQQLKEENRAYQKAVFPYKGAGKATAVNKTDGFVKLLYTEEYKEIIGATILGADASELIHEILLARKAELLPEDVATMIHAHPTLSEAVMEVMRGAEGWMIHA